VIGRRPRVAVFAVDDRSVQLTWRGLGPGAGSVRALDGDGRRLPGDASAPVPLDTHASGAGSIVLDGLPAGSPLTIERSGPEGATSAVTTRTLERLPGEERCRMATVSDLHLGTSVFGHRGTIVEHPPPEVAHPLRCSSAAVSEAVAWGAQRLAVKGDLTNNGAPEQWRAYARLVAEAAVPVDAIPGNHDQYHPSGFHHVTPPDAAVAFDLSIANPLIVRDLHGLRIVLVDSTIPAHNHGTLDPVVDAVLDAAAAADRSGAVLVLLHHQLQAHHHPEGWPVGVGRNESRRLLEGLARAHPHVLVSSGHTHRHRRWNHAGVDVTQVGSTKDFPGVWAGYVLAEGGLRQVVRRVSRPDCLAWTDHTRRAAAGLWGFIGIGRLDSRCFNLSW